MLQVLANISLKVLLQKETWGYQKKKKKKKEMRKENDDQKKRKNDENKDI